MSEVFRYSSVDFIKKVPCIWHGLSNTVDVHGEFDRLLCKRWEESQDRGYFRFKLDTLQTKILPGKLGFVAQLNVKRATDRRKPQEICSMAQPFNPQDFNFTKVKQHEILFEIERHGTDKDSSKHLLIINISPLEYGNSLLVPHVNLCLPQVLSNDSITMAIELVLLSSTPAFRAAFNSNGAFSSVNHHHFHVYYLQHRLLLETINVKRLSGDCHHLVDYPALGFAFQLTDKGIGHLSMCVFKVSDHLQGNNIGHNVFITRGCSFNSNDLSSYDTVRVYIWARKSTYGIKDDTAFNVACCELAGHLPIKQHSAFETITEEEVSVQLSEACEDTFNKTKSDIANLFLSDL